MTLNRAGRGRRAVGCGLLLAVLLLAADAGAGKRARCAAERKQLAEADRAYERDAPEYVRASEDLRACLSGTAPESGRASGSGGCASVIAAAARKRKMHAEKLEASLAEQGIDATVDATDAETDDDARALEVYSSLCSKVLLFKITGGSDARALRRLGFARVECSRGDRLDFGRQHQMWRMDLASGGTERESRCAAAD